MENSETIVSFFLENVGELPYRGWIERQLRKYSTRKLLEQVNQLTGALTDASPELGSRLRPMMMGWIDVTNARFGRDPRFWASASCRGAFSEVMEVAIASLPIEEQIPDAESSLLPENQGLAWILFQLPTVSFAYSASTQRAQRKLMGIRKGLFG